MGRCLFVHVCFCVERSRWKRGVEGSMRPPEALSKWLWQLWLKGRQWLQCDADEKTARQSFGPFKQPFKNFPTTLMQHSHNAATAEPWAEMFPIWFGNVLQLLWSAFDVTLPHIVTFMEARAMFWSLALHPLSFTCQVHQVFMKYVLCQRSYEVYFML